MSGELGISERCRLNIKVCVSYQVVDGFGSQKKLQVRTYGFLHLLVLKPLKRIFCAFA